MLFVKALLAFLILPGMVAFFIPLVWVAPRHDWNAFNPLGFILLIPGLIILLWTVKEFYTVGKGTLAPWTPPKHLVTSGLYRFSRNPMYVGVLLILVGWAVGIGTRGLWVYAVAVAIMFHFRVVFFEEPVLARLHGAEEFEAYRKRARRWL